MSVEQFNAYNQDPKAILRVLLSKLEAAEDETEYPDFILIADLEDGNSAYQFVDCAYQKPFTILGAMSYLHSIILRSMP